MAGCQVGLEVKDASGTTWTSLRQAILSHPGVFAIHKSKRIKDLGKWNISTSEGQWSNVAEWLDSNLMELYQSIDHAVRQKDPIFEDSTGPSRLYKPKTIATAASSVTSATTYATALRSQLLSNPISEDVPPPRTIYGKPTVVYASSLQEFPPLSSQNTHPDGHSTGQSTTTTLTQTAAPSGYAQYSKGRDDFEQKINQQMKDFETRLNKLSTTIETSLDTKIKALMTQIQLFGMEGGAAYVFEKKDKLWSDWTETQLESPGEAILMGSSIAATDTVIAVGSPETHGSKGAVYVYEKEHIETTMDGSESSIGHRWILTATLISNDGMENDYFGHELEISPDASSIMVSSGLLYTSRTGRQFVYQFDRVELSDPAIDGEMNRFRSTIWRQTTRFVPGNAPEYNSFGQSVAYSGNSMLVTSTGPARLRDADVGRGILYAFERGAKPYIGPQDTRKPQFHPGRNQVDFRDVDRSRWTNLFVSLLLIFLIHKVFLGRN